MPVIAAWLRLELRRRWRSLAVLALLIAMSTGTVLTAVAGARRGDTAAERLLARTLPADIVVLPNQPGFDWDAIRALPEVEALTTFPVTSFTIEGIPDSDYAGNFPPDREAMSSIERPVVLEGRLADPDRADEAVVTSGFADKYGLGVGDTVVIRLYTPESLEKSFIDPSPPPADGPRITTTIVGVVRSAWFSDQVGSSGTLIPSAGLIAQYPENLLGSGQVVYVNALLRLHGGEAAISQFRADLARVSGRTDIDVWIMAEKARRLQQTLSFESACLLAFGVAAFAAAGFLVGQAVARYTAATVADLSVLRALGMTPRQALVASCAAPGLAAVVGAAVGVGGAVVASAWMPIGAPAVFEPSPGLDVDLPVLTSGLVAVPLLVVAIAAAAAWLALGSGRRRLSSGRSAIARAAARAGLPVPVLIGARFALEPGRGRGAVPVRPAILGAVVGVLGILAAFTFSAGVADAADNPSRFGVTRQLDAFIGYGNTDFLPSDLITAAWKDDPDVTGLNDTRLAVAETDDVSISLFSYDPVGTPLDVVLTEGRMAESDGEIVLAPESAKAAGAAVGSSIELTGSTQRASRMTVTGIGFVPEGSHNDYAEGGWVTAEGYDRLFGPANFKFHLVLVALRPGADPAVVIPRLRTLAGAATDGGEGVELGPPESPTAILQIRDVQVLPLFLGGFLVLLAVGAVGHALATAVRRRRHDLAVLRALGMTRWQARGIVVTQATVLAVIGVVFGVPLGLALGRTLWRVVADITPLAYQPPMALLALLLVGPLAVLIANALAAWPGQRAARLRIGHVLRAE